MSETRLQLADGGTRIFGIIGDPITQVRSPAVYNERIRRLGKNAIIERYPCTAPA